MGAIEQRGEKLVHRTGVLIDASAACCSNRIRMIAGDGVTPLREQQELGYANLEVLLDRLGMPEFVGMPKPEFMLATAEQPVIASTQPSHHSNQIKLLHPSAARRLCVAVFEELMQRSVGPDMCSISHAVHGGAARLHDLVYEAA